MLPKPWHVGQAPNGLLNENRRGCGSSYAMPQARHSKRSREHVTRSALRRRRRDPRELDRERRAAALAVRRLDRVGQAAAQVARRCCTRSTTTCSVVRLAQRRRIDVVERDGAAVDEQAAEALAGAALSIVSAIGVDSAWRSRVGSVAREPRSSTVFARRSPLVDVRRVGRRRRASPRPAGRSRSAAACRRAARRAAAPRPRRFRASTSRPHCRQNVRPDAREQQPHVVVDLGRRADRRARVADAVLLADGDGRADALDAIDVRLLHPLEELAGVGRQRLDVAPLPFGVDRVEGERRLARSADAGDDR